MPPTIMTIHPERGRFHLPLRVVLLGGVTLVITLMAVVNILLLRRFSERHVNRTLGLLSDGLERVVREKVNERFDFPVLAMKDVADLAKTPTGLNALSSPQKMAGSFNFLLLRHPGVRSLYYALEDGTFGGGRRGNQPTGPQSLLFFYATPESSPRVSSHFSTFGFAPGASPQKTYEYDWRKEPEYIDALSRSGPVFGKMRRLPADDRVGIVFARPILNAQGKVLGIAGADVRMDVLGDSLRRILPTPGSFMMLIEEGRTRRGAQALIATSGDFPVVVSSPSGILQADTADCGSGLVSGAMKALEPEGGLPATMSAVFNDGGRAMRVISTPIQLSHAVQWRLVTVVPEAELLGRFTEEERRVVYLYGIVLLVTLSLLWAAGLMITRPLLRLRSHVRVFGENGAEQVPLPSSSIAEIDELSVSYNRMEDEVRETLATLEGRIRERTRELAGVYAHADQALKLSKAGYWSFRPGGRRLISASPRCAELCGYALRQDGLYPIEDWIEGVRAVDPVAASDVLRDFEDCCAGRTPFFDVSYSFLRKTDGRRVRLRTIGAPLRSEESDDVEIYGVTQDITEEYEVRVELEDARVAAEQANRLKSEFLANMSHEIRTPMNAILGYTQLMQRDGTLPADLSRKVQTISRAGEHLLALINDILEMSKIEAGKITYNECAFNPRKLISDAVELNAERARAKGLTLDLEFISALPSCILSDEGKLRQALLNLVGNAVKFTAAGGVRVAVAATPGPDRAWRFVLEVRDTGPGIAGGEIGKLFHPFVQSAAGRQSGGTGLGLAISRRYANMLGGDITVESEPGRGSRFSLSIIARECILSTQCEKTPPPKVSGLVPEDRGARVLIVDDEPVNRELLESLLLPLGFELRTATNGVEAMDVIVGWKPKAVLMDVRMPLMNGVEATRRIKSEPGWRDIFILGLTASAFEENKSEVFASGADAYMRKPFNFDELLEVLGRGVGVRYVHASDAAHPPSGVASSPKVPAIPETLRMALLSACDAADYDSLVELCSELERGHPDLAATIRPIIEAYDYARVSEVLRSESDDRP